MEAVKTRVNSARIAVVGSVAATATLTAGVVAKLAIDAFKEHKHSRELIEADPFHVPRSYPVSKPGPYE